MATKSSKGSVPPSHDLLLKGTAGGGGGVVGGGQSGGGRVCQHTCMTTDPFALFFFASSDHVLLCQKFLCSTQRLERQLTERSESPETRGKH